MVEVPKNIHNFGDIPHYTQYIILSRNSISIDNTYIVAAERSQFLIITKSTKDIPPRHLDFQYGKVGFFFKYQF